MQHLAELPDEMLVAEYASGCNEAFDVLLRRYQQRIFSYIISVVKDRDVANDIFQEAFVKAITTIRSGRYNESGRFGSWISRIVHNLVMDHFRQERVENAISADDMELDVLNRSELCDSTVEDRLVSSQILTDVRRIVKALPEPQREVLEMRYYRDMSFKEIAEHTNVSINTALGRMRYALINMRRMAERYNISLCV